MKEQIYINENFFSKIDSELKAYLLGIFFCGGLLRPNRQSITFKSKLEDKEIIDLISNQIYQKNNVFSAKNEGFKGGVISKLVIISEKIKNDLLKLGCNESRSLNKYPNLSDDLLPHFMRGIFDKFGYFDFSKDQNDNGPYRIIYIAENEYNLNYISDLLNQLNIKHRVNNRIEVSTKEGCLQFLNYIYNIANYKLSRKYIKYQNFITANNKFSESEMKQIIMDIDIIYYFNQGMSADRIAKKINSTKRVVLLAYKRLGFCGIKRFGANKEMNRLRKSISGSIRQGLLKRNFLGKGGKSCSKYLPYTFVELKKYIESLWEPWMNWDNFGQYLPKLWVDNDVSTWRWNIDHIIPHSTFNYFSMEDDDFKKCWAITNLRPYNAKQNILDGAKRTRHYVENSCA